MNSASVDFGSTQCNYRNSLNSETEIVDHIRTLPDCHSRSLGSNPDKILKRTLRQEAQSRSRIHKRTISLRFLGIIMRVIKLVGFRMQCLHSKPVSNHFCFLGGGGGGGKNPLVKKGDFE